MSFHTVDGSEIQKTVNNGRNLPINLVQDSFHQQYWKGVGSTFVVFVYQVAISEERIQQPKKRQLPSFLDHSGASSISVVIDIQRHTSPQRLSQICLLACRCTLLSNMARKIGIFLTFDEPEVCLTTITGTILSLPIGACMEY